MIIANAAYGRTYSSVADAMRDYEEGKDFKIIDGPYFSVRDFSMMRQMAETARVLDNEEYVIEIRFPLVVNGEFVKISKFYVNFNGLCTIAP